MSRRPKLDQFLIDQAKEKMSDKDIIRFAEGRGYIIHKPEPPAAVVDFDPDRIKGNRVSVGIVSDLHFGSKYQQPTFLRQHLAYMKRRKVNAILVPGDVTDGATAMHPGFEYELWAHGADMQAEFAVETFPKLGIPYYFIGGNHDASHFKADGVDVVRHICEARDDFTYLAPDEQNHRGSIGYVRFGEVSIQLCHPHLGGTRTRSYRMERWVEELSPESKPHIVAMGNFHKIVALDYRNVYGIMLPSYQAQSGWMASKGISSYVGGTILTFGTENRGLAPSVITEWVIERVPNHADYPGG